MYAAFPGVVEFVLLSFSQLFCSCIQRDLLYTAGFASHKCMRLNTHLVVQSDIFFTPVL